MSNNVKTEFIRGIFAVLVVAVPIILTWYFANLPKEYPPDTTDPKIEVVDDPTTQQDENYSPNTSVNEGASEASTPPTVLPEDIPEVYLVSGRVKDENGEPVPHATVEFLDQEVQSDERGRFKISVSSNNEKRLYVSKKGYETYSSNVIPPEDQIVITLSPK
jgi:protocatechuate 3,4-dioxygenase beta subunit